MKQLQKQWVKLQPLLNFINPSINLWILKIRNLTPREERNWKTNLKINNWWMKVSRWGNTKPIPSTCSSGRFLYSEVDVHLCSFLRLSRNRNNSNSNPTCRWTRRRYPEDWSVSDRKNIMDFFREGEQITKNYRCRNQISIFTLSTYQ